jgi:hypothetical protein
MGDELGRVSWAFFFSSGPARFRYRRRP